MIQVKLFDLNILDSDFSDSKFSYCATMFADFGAPDITAIAGLSRERLVGVLSLIKSEEGHDCRPVYGSTGDEKFGCLVHHLAKFGLTPNGE